MKCIFVYYSFQKDFIIFIQIKLDKSILDVLLIFIYLRDKIFFDIFRGIQLMLFVFQGFFCEF